VPSSDIRIEQRRVNIGAATIAYEVAGDGPPIILVHGLAGSSRWWARNIRPLAKRFRVHVVDLIGFGSSRNRQRFVLDQAASHLARWMEQIGVRRAGVVGHSMGGYIAAELAADHPDKVERLVLVDAAALPFDQDFSSHILSMFGELRSMRPDFLPTLFYDALRAGPLTLWSAASGLLHADLRPKLPRIKAPTLVVWGQHDALVPLQMGKQLCRHLGTRELLVIKSAGHNPMWDCPQAFNQVAGAFLAGERSESREHTVECAPQPQVELQRPRVAESRRMSQA
jgi:pimeloyl-ACP methyl ester carboxylesterase